MVLDLLLRLINEAQQRSRQAQEEAERQAAAMQGIPMAMPAAGPPKKKKKKKKEQAVEGAPAPEKRRVRRPEAPEITAPATSPAPDRPDLARMFVLGEILGPPMALRDEE